MLRRLKIVSVFTFSVLLMLALSDTTNAQTFPAFPMAFWGTVNINGNAAPAGIVIEAFYSNSVLAGEVTISNSGTYGDNNSTGEKLLVSEGTGPITFEVVVNGSATPGLNPQTETSFVSGLTEEKDLNFNILTPAAPVTVSGGGGGGGLTSTVTPQASTTTTDINGETWNYDNVGIMDFSVMMSEWGEGGSNLAADLNHDGVVNILDFAMMMADWNS
jgi:hypothetical protein